VLGVAAPGPRLLTWRGEVEEKGVEEGRGAAPEGVVGGRTTEGEVDNSSPGSEGVAGTRCSLGGSRISSTSPILIRTPANSRSRVAMVAAVGKYAARSRDEGVGEVVARSRGELVGRGKVMGRGKVGGRGKAEAEGVV